MSNMCEKVDNQEEIDYEKMSIEDLIKDNKELRKNILINKDQIIGLKESLDKVSQNADKSKLEAAEAKDKMLRNRAELENFKRRVTDEKITERKYALTGILSKLITVQDNFERALAKENIESTEAFIEGVQKIEKQFGEIITNEGLEEIEALGKPFNPELHQAVLNDSVEDKENEVVLEVLQKGYKYKERVLRPAMVKVNQK